MQLSFFPSRHHTPAKDMYPHLILCPREVITLDQLHWRCEFICHIQTQQTGYASNLK